MPTIRQNLTTINREVNCNNPKWIVVHNVGTPPQEEGSAYANTQYFKNGYRAASAHYFIDNGNTIWQCVRDCDAAWAVGDSQSRNGCTNYNSISIEVCGNSKFTDKEITTLRWLVRHLMKQYHIPASRVCRHHDVTTKNCPAYYVPSARWNDLKKTITEEESMGWKGSGDKWWYKNSDGSYPAEEWEKINGEWYYFDKNGYIVHGWQELRGKDYYFDEEHNGTFGAMVTGWEKIKGIWYFFNEHGVMMKDCIIMADEKIYALNEHGHQLKGELTFTTGEGGCIKAQQ